MTYTQLFLEKQLKADPTYICLLYNPTEPLAYFQNNTGGGGGGNQ